MQKQAHVVVISGRSIDASILYRFTTLDCVNMTGNGWVFFNSRFVGCETSGGCAHRADLSLAPALGHNAHAKKIDGLDIELLRRMPPAKRSRRPLVDPGRTLLWD